MFIEFIAKFMVEYSYVVPYIINLLFYRFHDFLQI